MKRPKTIYITESDWDRLERLMSGAGKAPNIAKLRSELDEATVVPSEEIPSDVVTMNSRVSVQELDTGEKSEITLVYPSDADVNRRRISILAPVGAAILGLRVGDEIEWPLPSGKTRTYRIVSVLFQPEAEGRYDL